MKIVIISIFLMLFVKFNAFSQQDTINYRPKNVIYGEIMGSSIVLGVGYERILLSKKKYFISTKHGLSTALLINGANAGVSFNYGVNKFFIEVKQSFIISYVIPILNAGYFMAHYSPSIGFRFFPTLEHRIAISINYCPLVLITSNSDEKSKITSELLHWGGLSVGFAF